MKNTIDLTDGRVFRDKPEEKPNPLWSNYGNHFPSYFNPKPVKKEDYSFEYNESDDTFYLRSFTDSDWGEWTEYNIIDSDLNSMYLTSNPQSATYTINANQINSTSMRHRRRNRIQYVYRDNQLGEWKNLQWNFDLQNKTDVSNVLQVLKAKRFISDMINTPMKMKDRRYDLFFVSSFEQKYRTLKGCMRCNFYVPDLDKPMDSGSVEYPFQTPEYTSDDERTVPLLFERRRPTIDNLWKNYKRGEKNPLNSWNLDPDFLDEEIEMPRDSTFMDLIGRPEDVIRGIN